MDTHTISTVSRYLLSTQLLVGATARLLPSLTPTLSRIAYSHADQFRTILPVFPSSSGTQHTRLMGYLLAAGGVLLLIPRDSRTAPSSSRHGLRSLLVRVGEGLAVVLPGLFLYAHVRLGLGLGVPVGNLMLGCLVVWGRGRGGYGVRDEGVD